MLEVKTPSTFFTLPTDWSEVTLSQYIALYRQATNVTMRGILKALASDKQALLDSNASIDAPTMERLTFLSTIPDFTSLPVPTKIAGVKPPTDLGDCTLLQKWAFQDQIEDMDEEGEPINFITVAMPVLAIYLYPLLTNTKLNDAEEIEQVMPIIEALPVTEALPLANFFLSNYQSLIGSGRVSYSIKHPNRSPRPWLIQWFRNWKLLNNIWFYRPSLKKDD